MNRRDALKLTAASLSLYGLPSFAKQSETTNSKKLIWILLRGGMDGLHATMPLFDKHFSKTRPDLITPIEKNALPIERGFALHPQLKFLHHLYQQQELSTVIATSIPNIKRSHFDAQDLLESGLPKADPDNGWLSRTMVELNSQAKQSTAIQQGLAISRAIPIAMRGSHNTSTWYPSTLPPSKENFHQRLFQLYKNDKMLSMRLEQALATQKLVNNIKQKKRHGKFSNLARSCATLMNEVNGPNIAMLESNGWDTHKGQVLTLKKRFTELDDGIQALRNGLKSSWQDTMFIVTTEFGRTVKINGTGGTDHGMATTMFIGGGAIGKTNKKKLLTGGKVLGQWPGLAPDNLFEGRDLMPTSNTFDWIASALQQHWQLSDSQIARIFPKA